jgi:hypothetical protein
MTSETPLPSFPAPCLVQIRAEPNGNFTAHLVGQSDFAATAPTREKAVDSLRATIQQRLHEGSLMWIDVPRENPVMSRFGYAKDAPDFEAYLEDIRRFREEMDLREQRDTDADECPDTFLTPTT